MSNMIFMWHCSTIADEYGGDAAAAGNNVFSFMLATLAANIYCSCSLRTNAQPNRALVTGRPCNYLYYHFPRAHLHISLEYRFIVHLIPELIC